MKDFKKRTLILMLASVVTVTGSFAADNYKNCLMDLVFKSTGPNEINVILNTKKPYDDSLTSRKIDENTYVIMLPEFDNAAPTPNLSDSNGNIESVDIKKMPYSNGSKGYTKILIKTSENINLNASTALYIPSAETREITTNQSREEDNIREQRESNIPPKPITSPTQNTVTPPPVTRPAPIRETRRVQDETPSPQRQYETPPPRTTRPSTTRPSTTTNQNDLPIKNDIATPETSEHDSLTTEEPTQVSTNNDSSYQKFLIGLMTLLIIFISGYIFIKAKDKMVDVMGENLNIDIDDKPDKKDRKSKNKNKTRRPAKQFNSEYINPDTIQLKSLMEDNVPKETESDADNVNIVDLDALYKEQAGKTIKNNEQEDETNALDDFLNGFVFEEENPQASEKEEAQESSYSEEDYESVINDSNIVFTEDDMECFKELLQSEVNDSTIRNIEHYAHSNPIPPQKPSPEKLLENIVTEYAVSRDIIFTADDINIIKQLLSVEIDESFVKDLRTNSKHTKEMEKEILSAKDKKVSTTEILTLKVKNILPNLKDAMKKQGNRPIVSDAKPETVYFSEGYDVSTLSIGDALPDLSKEIKNKKAFDSKPSDLGPIVDQTYSNSVEKISISGLPDLEDVLANPDKYAEPKKEEVIPDEQALLDSILNVQFKPFDDGTRQFEIINDIEEESPEEAPSVEDIQKEFSQFNNFEVATYDESERPYTYNDYDDFEALYDESFVDLDSNRNKPQEKKIPQNKPQTGKKKIHKPDHFAPMDLKRVEPVSSQNRYKNKSAELIHMIQAAKEKKAVVKTTKNIQPAVQNNKAELIKDNEKQSTVKCILDSVSYNIVGTAAINSEVGCHLAKSNDKYVIFAYNGDNLSVLKSYDSLKTEKIAARLSETLEDGTPRYLVKVGANKFIIDIKDGKINYVMDLC